MSNDREVRTGRRLVIIAGVTLVVIGAGHILLGTILGFEVIAQWFAGGIWSVVPFVDPAPSIASLTSSRTFWSGIGGFAVPLVLVGALLVHFARRSLGIPSWVGWSIGIWGLFSGILIGPTPYFILPIVGALIIVAAHPTSRARTERS